MIQYETTLHSNIYFEDLEIYFTGYTIFLDIDGTILIDRSAKVDDKVLQKIRNLKDKNVVLLCTNSKDSNRSKKIAKFLGLSLVDSKYKKPSAKILEDLEIDNIKKMVIGDKFMTDGIFAMNIGASFLKVKRKVSSQDNFLVSYINNLDDLIYFLGRKFNLINF